MILVKYLILVILIILCLYLKKNPKYENFQEPIYAIHTVFILRENILFLEQWIDYHIQLGFNKFYLYDNSKVEKSGGCHVKKYFKPGSVNKYKVNYGEILNLNDTELQKKLQLIKDKYPNVEVSEWSPKDHEGNIHFKQNDAFAHCLKKIKKENVKWCANIDMDEFIVINKGQTISNFIKNLDPKVSAVKLGQIRFNSRFEDIGKLVIDIQENESKILSKHHSPKHLYRVKDTQTIKVHFWRGLGKEINLDQSKICFNHYKIKNLENPRKTDNIHPKIREKIYQNSKNYIKIPYRQPKM